MFGKFKWLTLILLVLLCTACTLEDNSEEKNPPGYATVNFNANGGNGTPPASITERFGDNINLPNPDGLSRLNHTFGGWNTNNKGTGVNYPAGSSYTVPGANITLYAKWDENQTTTQIEEFKTAGNYSFSLSTLPGITFPATVEVYALGAGGGGQGGHRNYNLLGITTDRGSGAAGGGGAAAYGSFTTNSDINFTITLGSGGNGGNGIWTNPNWRSGSAGGNGGQTTVNWNDNSISIVAGGGRGGGGSGTSLTAGAGGVAGSRPSGLTNWSAANGSPGTAGSRNSDKQSRGGNSATIIIGSASIGNGQGAVRNIERTSISTAAGSGGGGAGNYGDVHFNGSRGGDGHVIIVVTYQD